MVVKIFGLYSAGEPDSVSNIFGKIKTIRVVLFAEAKKVLSNGFANGKTDLVENLKLDGVA